MDKWILDDEGHVTKAASVEEWGRWFETADRTIAKDTVGDWDISTVFLSINHNFSGKGAPILFETIAFYRGEGSHEKDQEQERYRSREGAEDGHARMVSRAEIEWSA